jgi:hypothetical protein
MVLMSMFARRGLGDRRVVQEDPSVIKALGSVDKVDKVE